MLLNLRVAVAEDTDVWAPNSSLSFGALSNVLPMEFSGRDGGDMEPERFPQDTEGGEGEGKRYGLEITREGQRKGEEGSV